MGKHVLTSALPYVNIKDYGGKGDGTTNNTQAFNDACTYLLTLGGGEVQFPPGTYKLNIDIPSGITVVGKSGGKINSTYPGGTIFGAFDPTKPVVKIVGTGTTMKQGIRIKDILINGTVTPSSTDGLYIAGANYVTIQNVSITNFPRYNIFIENLLNLSTFFIFLTNVTTYNAGQSNFKVLETTGLTSFTTTVIGQNFVSFNLPANTTEGCVAYIGAPVHIDGYLESDVAKFVVIDKDVSLNARLTGRGCIIDGTTSLDIIKCKYATDTYSVVDYLSGDVFVDGKIFFSASGLSSPATAFGAAPYYPRLNNPKVYDYLTFQDQGEKAENAKLYPRIYQNGGTMFIDHSRTDSKGLFLIGTFDKPLGISAGATVSRWWFDGTNGVLRMKNTPGAASSITNGDIVVGNVPVPASKTASGKQGQISSDANYMYMCYSDNNWIRVAKDGTW